MKHLTVISLLLIFFGCMYTPASAQQPMDKALLQKIDKQVHQIMNEGDIPGLSLVVINGNEQLIRNYGYADAENKQAVTNNTLFQLGSTTKAFTALAALKLANDHVIDLDKNVSDYLPWFQPEYKGKKANITLRQLLHHTSGISWKTISYIPVSNGPDALEKTVKAVAGIKLERLPGKKYEYATVNYDILALVMQTASGQSFERYLQDSVLAKLQLTHTSIGTPVNGSLMSEGYKIGFFKARPYDAPVFKGNNAAGYIISDANDIARWLGIQMGLIQSELSPLIKESHLRDETVAPQGLNSYAMGWQVSLSGNGEISHEGLNPNFTSYFAFRPAQKRGIAVLANSNSNFTPLLGDRIMKLLSGEEIKNNFDPGDGNDKVYSVLTVVFAGFLLFILGYLGLVIVEMIRGKRIFQGVSFKSTRSIAFSLLLIAPILYGLYLFPNAMGLTWDAIMVWTPSSFVSMITLLAASIAVSYLVFLLSMFFKGTYEYKKQVPKIILIGILSGIANMAIILMITSSMQESVPLKYIMFYYLMALLVYISARRYVQINLIRITRGLIYDIRLQLIDKIFSTSYQRFEKIDRGRVYSTLNDDVGVVGESATMLVGFLTSLITTVGAFIYLATVSFWATMLALALVVGISLLYFFMGSKTQVYFEEARNTRNVFMRLVNGMIDGFKEISLQRDKKLAYKNDISVTTKEYKEKSSTADRRFVVAYLTGETSLILLFGFVAFGIPKIFPDVAQYTAMTFLIVLLYLNGPLNTILTSVPGLMQLKVAWGRIHSFIKEIPANIDLNKIPETINKNTVQSIRTEGICFKYKGEQGGEGFSVGPVDLKVDRGEILFIIGGNGSGKTTLAKMITGLYEPDSGKIFLNDKEIKSAQLSEYFSAVFSPCHLFPKLYNTELNGRSAEVKRYLKLLGLSDKVEIENNQYSTINLSGGQRKRLALLQCYLEDSPIFLFDEWTADQDPEYRRFFYRELLPEMKRRGKLVIAITHDDHYFDVADKILKLDVGKVEYVANDFRVDGILSN